MSPFQHVACWMAALREMDISQKQIETLGQVLGSMLEVNGHLDKESLEALVEREIGHKPEVLR